MAHSQTSFAEPQAGRPYMPEGYGAPQDDAGLIPWSKARAALEQARLYCVSTTRRDHLAAVPRPANALQLRPGILDNL